MPGVTWKAIVPRNRFSPSLARSNAEAVLGKFATYALKDMKDYPAAQPWRRTPPRTGPRAGGRRTGAYGRGWTQGARDYRSVTVENPVGYATYVGGSKRTRPGQTANMASRNWPSISDVGEKAMARAVLAVKLTKVRE